MARGKKSSGKHYQSKGQRPNVSTKILNQLASQYSGSIDQLVNKIKAWKLGKNVTITIPNPNTAETNKRFIKVSMTEAIGKYQGFKTF